MFGGIEALVESQDWWLRDQASLAAGFDNWDLSTTGGGGGGMQDDTGETINGNGKRINGNGVDGDVGLGGFAADDDWYV